MRGGDAVTRPAIGPGPATLLGLAGIGAGFALRIGRRLERPVIAAEAIDRIFDGACLWLDHAGAADAGDAAGRLRRRHHVALEKAHRRRPGPGRIGKAPGFAVLLALAAAGTDRRIAVRHG